MSETIAWAVKTPQGTLLMSCIRDTEQAAQIAFAGSNWPLAEKKGYRCIRVCIRAMEVKDVEG